MKVHKVLLTPELKKWLIETSEALDSSVGDSIRMLLSFALVFGHSVLYPEYKPSKDIIDTYTKLLEECRKEGFNFEDHLENRKRFVLDSLWEAHQALKHHCEQKDKKYV